MLKYMALKLSVNTLHSTVTQALMALSSDRQSQWSADSVTDVGVYCLLTPPLICQCIGYQFLP